MKVPIDRDEEKPQDQSSDATPEDTQEHKDQSTENNNDTADTKAADNRKDISEEDMIQAAIKAGEQAAADDLKKDADKAASERDGLAKKLSDAEDELKKAQEAQKAVEDKFIRLQAEWQNFRKRANQERADERSRANERLIGKLLPVLDDMERAIQHAKNSADKDQNLTQFAEGIEAVHTKLLGILGGEGVEVIDPAGEPFDPLLHQAVGREENTDVYEDTVAQVYQKGYRMGDKIIRSAMVTVTYGGKKRSQEKKDNDKADKDTAEDTKD